MNIPLLSTKFYIPPVRPGVVSRPRLLERLDAGFHAKLILISAPAGYGKTTLITQWIQQIQANNTAQICWYSLDEDDHGTQQFFRYLASAVEALPGMQSTLKQLIQSPQPQPLKNLMNAFINDTAAVSTPFFLILDDYHVIESAEIDQALDFIIDNMPPLMTLVITSRSDPGFPIARRRARAELIELRVNDLRFTEVEARQFIQQTTNLDLSLNQIAALETRTEGWIAGLQMAALSIQGKEDTDGFIHAFTGSNRFVLDYLVEEVLQIQPERVRNFLLRTSILDELCGPLCDAVTGQNNGRAMLEELECSNLFVIPLDNERRWYRYHHLFAELLRQRFQQSAVPSTGEKGIEEVEELHIRASKWFEDNGLEIEAFQHAAAANDVERAARLIEGKGTPLHFKGAASQVLNWLTSLPESILNDRPSLWLTYASVLLFVGQNSAAEPKLQAAEAAIAKAESDDEMRDLIGRIAAMRATMAVVRNDLDIIISQSQQALAYLHPENSSFRTAVNWTLGYAYQFQGDRLRASQAYNEIISSAETFENSIYYIAALTSLGQIQETDNQLTLAAESYEHVLRLAGNPPLPIACEAHLGLARLNYQWNDLDTAQKHEQESLQLMQQIESVETVVSHKLFLARLLLAQGDVSAVDAVFQEAEAYIHQHNFLIRMADVAAIQVIVALSQGDLVTATNLAQKHHLPISQARIHLAQGNPRKALELLAPVRQQAEERKWQDVRLQVLVLQALAYWAQGSSDTAVEILKDALVSAKSGGFIRIFVDEGPSLARLLYEVLARGIEPTYVHKLLAAFSVSESEPAALSLPPDPEAGLIEPLSIRELEVLQVIAEGLSNQEVANQLFLSLHTVKVHARNIYAKLGVKNRTQAVAKARTLGILSKT
jgi:LuxR family maltose regulon positive regulatory protein